MRMLFPSISAAIACLSLTGWLMGDDLDGMGGTIGRAHPASALGILMLGAVILMFQSHKPGRFACHARLPLVMALTVWPVTELADSLFGTHIGLSRSNLYRSLPGVPAGLPPNTSFCFAMLGLAIILSRRLGSRNHAPVGKPAIIASQLAAMMALAVGLLAVIGHVYHAGSFVALDGARPMSLPTAVCIVLLAAGTLLVEPGRGVVRYVTSEGPAGTMSRFLLPVSVLVPVCLGWLRVEGIRAGLFDAEFGIALSALLNVLMLFALTLLVARKLYQLDQKARLVETELLYRATHDSLTGLVNRPVFREQLLRRIKMARGRRKPNFAVFYLDLDGFKQVNDRFGHDAGDRLLVEVADILRSCTRASDTVARFGGDEFVILFEEIDGREDACMLADRIVRQVPQSFGEGERKIPIGISVGVALNPGRPTTPDEMLREADLALYKAKTTGKGCYRVGTQMSEDRYQMSEGDLPQG